MALELAVAREDYAEAARLKKAIGAGAQQAETAAATGIDQRQAFLLEGDSIDKMIASAGEGVVVLHWTDGDATMTNSMIERVASMYAGSQIAGGTPVAFVQVAEQGVEQLGRASLFEDPRRSAASGLAPASLDTPPSAPAPLPPGWREATDPASGRAYYISPERETTWTRPLSTAAAAAQALFAERGIASLPTTQLWKGGELLQEVGSMGLEKALLALGARPVTGSSASLATERDRLRDRDGKGDGRPSATAVDDIDFTGGKAGYGGTEFRTKWNDRNRVNPTTGGLTRADDLRDKPGDGMNKDGSINPFGERDDFPPGYGPNDRDPPPPRR